MFGTLKPHRCVLGPDMRLEHARLYCGLCKSLGDRYGTPSRLLVGHDAVVLALLADGLLDEPAPPDRCRCPLLPVAHRPTVRPDSAAMRFAAAVQMLLGDQWLADRAIEGKPLAVIARPLAAGYVAQAKQDLAALGVSLDPLDGFERRQARCEVLGETGPEAAARPTAEALGVVFASIADLPGAGGALRSGAARADLTALGRAVGCVIYWADALDDVRRDRDREEFNPCLVREPAGRLAISGARVARCARLLDAALAEIRRLVARLPWRRHREVVENILCAELPAASRRAAASARAAAGEDARSGAALALLRASFWSRLLRRAAVVAMIAWTWLLGIRSVLAQDAGRRKTPSVPPRAAGADAGADAGA
ncbi:MAG: hypothetical protein IT372_34100, partial [Polyangiaceae bacterium]|nr:hypothetical protein [Polyangiaceae bacterium]